MIIKDVWKGCCNQMMMLINGQDDVVVQNFVDNDGGIRREEENIR